MNTLKKFSVESGKELFIFEYQGRTATISTELLAFEGYTHPKKAWNDIKERECFETGYEFETLEGEELKRFKNTIKQSDDLTQVVTNSVTTLYDQYKSVPRIDIVFEEGIFGTMYASNSGHATHFKKFMRREVNPQIRKAGRYDQIENELEHIEDEKERNLRIKIKQYGDILKHDKNDLVASHQLNSCKLELDIYLNSNAISEVNEKVDNIEEKLSKTTVLREGDLSPKAISKKFNVCSLNNLPHSLFAENLAMDLGIYVSPQGNTGYQDEYISINLTDKGGKTVPEVKYSKAAYDLMVEHIKENGLIITEPKYFSRGKKKGMFDHCYILFNGKRQIKINEKTYKYYCESQEAM
ncbi:hypothetical protein P8917_09345 [Bacillus atrophaeus]|uniref:hypothetical protein n=1 Tax=Bacillus atrophaeus TaxID=1452 RepID=UPI0022816C83|nr:hypothetical protein [Bacillus atrophaeus]MCY8499752.1 hypothetical protein [Bacillus atrophaeus]MCY8815044.1 hypothetical protein [Bacillus atrophaeus]MCY8823213.1 hypothetical protein [Bacillus atrophaeus]MCY8834926.1 hypothetical protein [Bacillus atrophaeus]MEC0748307.1 hypothetical protein [Bacillus atrophaeus]